MDRIFPPIKERVLYFIENQKIVKENFYKETGISASNFKGKGAKSEFGGEKIVSILTHYPQLNSEWLLLGTGEMLKPTPNSYVDTQTTNDYDAKLASIQQQLDELRKANEKK